MISEYTGSRTDGLFAAMEQINGDNVNFLGPRILCHVTFGPSTFWAAMLCLGQMSVPSVSSFTSS